MTEATQFPLVTVEWHKGQAWLCLNGDRRRVATPYEVGLSKTHDAEIERIKEESENAPRWEQVREWLAEACPGRDWEAGVMPTGRNGDDGKLPD